MKQSDSRSQRDTTLRQLAAGPLDVLIIGGGIVGAGVARDAAMRGLKTGLIEQHDFASGTSSRSSRLLHGGLRYLAQGRFGLVREASREKHVLKKIAPHLTEPLAFLFPTYKGSEWSYWKLRAGVKIYDWLCGTGNLGRSSGMDVPKVLSACARTPLQQNGLTGAVRYFDALTNDSRLVLDTLRSARRHGVLLCNYVRFEDAAREANLWQCRVRDMEAFPVSPFNVAGQNGAGVLQARCVISATGPWSDQLAHNTIALRLTKGVHLVIDRHRLPLRDAVVMTEGARILFAIPWGDRVILGTTDTDYRPGQMPAVGPTFLSARFEQTGMSAPPRVGMSAPPRQNDPLARVTADVEDIRYILDVTNRNFPDAQLSEKEVLSTWAGLRPLIADSGGGPSDVSRSHVIRMNEPNWLELGGGKLTTYRVMAEQAVDRVLLCLGMKRIRSRTASELLVSSDEAQGVSGVLPPPVTEEAVAHYCNQEWAMHLDDIMLRRSSWHHYCTDRGRVAQQVALWMAVILNWESTRVNAELERYRVS